MRLFLFAAFALALLTSCRARGPIAPHTGVGPKASALREAFNAQQGKVRLVLLVSPV